MSKFDALKRGGHPQEDEQPALPTVSQPVSPVPIVATKSSRATGKRSNPDYTQIGAYIPKTLNRDVKRLLVDEDGDLSDLITGLLQDWVSSKAVKR